MRPKTFPQLIRKLIKKNDILVIGLNGANSSGKELKGTALHDLCKEGLPPDLSMCRIVISDEIAWHIEHNSSLAEPLRRAQRLQEEGKLVPNGPIFELLWIALRREIGAGHKIVLLDGFPRKMSQAKLFIGAEWFSMIYLKTTLKTSLARAKKRREERIVKKLQPRKDDRPSRVRYRYSEVFRKETLPAIKAIEAGRHGSVKTVQAAKLSVRFQLVHMVEAVRSAVGPNKADWRAIFARIADAEDPIGKRLYEIDQPPSPSPQALRSKPDRSACPGPTTGMLAVA